MSVSVVRRVTPDRREKQIEISWRQHDPSRAKVPHSARRAAGAFKDALAGDAERIKGALQGHALPLIHEWSRKGAIGRERKLLRIKQALAPARVEDVNGALLVLWQEAHGQMVLIDDPRFKQNCVIVVAALGSRVKGRIRWASMPVVEAPDHALARMFQRAPGLDAKAALYEAARAFLAADARAVTRGPGLGETLCLAAGPGMLLCLPIAGPDLEGEVRLVARANTWIAAGQASPGQRPVKAAENPVGSVLAAVR